MAAAALLVLAGTPAAAQQRAAEQTIEGQKYAGGATATIIDTDYWLNYLKVPYRLVSAPFDWSLGDWGKAALVGGGAFGLMFLDEDLKDFFQDDLRGGFTDDLSDIARPFGEGSVLLPTIAGGYLIGALSGSRRLAGASLIALQSFAIAGGLTEGIKRIARRRRPTNSNDAFDFEGPGGDEKSFVSGHATHAFAVATAFAMEYRDSYVIPPLAYGLASLTAFSRVNDNKHWTSDVVLGAGLGFVVGVLAHKLSPFGTGARGVALLPRIGRRSAGLQISARF